MHSNYHRVLSFAALTFFIGLTIEVCGAQNVVPGLSHPTAALLSEQQKRVCALMAAKRDELDQYQETLRKLAANPLMRNQVKPPVLSKYDSQFATIMGSGEFTDFVGTIRAFPISGEDGKVGLDFSFVCPVEKKVGSDVQPIEFSTLIHPKRYNLQPPPGTAGMNMDAPVIKLLTPLPGNQAGSKVSGHLFAGQKPDSYMGLDAVGNESFSDIGKVSLNFTATFTKVVLLTSK